MSNQGHCLAFSEKKHGSKIFDVVHFHIRNEEDVYDTYQK